VEAKSETPREPTEDGNAVTDPMQLGYSLANVRELLIACLDAAEARSVLEIGSYEGELTAFLLDWGAERGATVAGLDPVPPEKLLELADQRPELTLIDRTSHEHLAELDALPEAIVIDGDHNYYTLSEELRLIAEKANGDFPLLLFHDVLWPHARGATYHAPDRIPEDRRQPLGHDVGLVPGNPDTNPLGLPFVWAALREGGPGNGTFTALEDFLADHDELQLAVVPAFFGFGVMWNRSGRRSDAIAATVAPYDRHPVLERLERNRVEHVVAGQARARELEALRARQERLEAILRRLDGSAAFAVAERLSALRQRGKPLFSRAEVRDVLDGSGSPGTS
jgi:hypothetical protein